MVIAIDDVRKDDPSILDEWLGQCSEEALEPEIPIIDPHHHLRDFRNKGPIGRYLFDDLLADVSSGHNIRATVVVESMDNMYRADGPLELRCVGQTEFMNGVAAMFASGQYGSTLACAGIVGYADLQRGARVASVLDAHIASGGGRFRGIRTPATWDDSEQVRVTLVGPKGVLVDAKFREGFACLAPRNLSYDAWVYHPQLGELLDLARAFPDTSIIVNHCGGPLGIGPYAGKRSEVFESWSKHLHDLAQCPGVYIKLGGLGSPRAGFCFEKGTKPRSSLQLAQAWRPYVETCINMFGPMRCMFESNFPPDKVSCSYRVLWNAFKRIVSSYSATEKAALFGNAAVAAYRIG